MHDKWISYKDISDGQTEVKEWLERKSRDPDPYIVEDLAKILQINDLDIQINSFIEIQDNKMDELSDQIHYSYNEFGTRTDLNPHNKRSKELVKNAKRKDEVVLMKEEDKIDILNYIKDKWLVVDSIKCMDDDDKTVTYLSAVIWDIEMEENDDEDESPWVFVFPEFVLNASWNVEPSPDEGMTLEMEVDQIKEIIVDETKYTFMF